MTQWWFTRWEWIFYKIVRSQWALAQQAWFVCLCGVVSSEGKGVPICIVTGNAGHNSHTKQHQRYAKRVLGIFATRLAVYHKILLIFWLRDWRSANCFLWLDWYVPQCLRGELLLSNSILQQYTTCLQTPSAGDAASLAALGECCIKTASRTRLLWEYDKETRHPTSFLLKNPRFTMEMITTFAISISNSARFHKRGL